MEKHFDPPVIPVAGTVTLLLVFLLELGLYGALIAIPYLWLTLAFGAFYIIYTAIIRRDVLPLIFSILFFTAHHSLLYHSNSHLPLSVLFLIILIVNTGIMWLLLRYGTRLRAEHTTAYALISGFLIAQIITLFASMVQEWPFRFELAAYVAALFCYISWRFACLSAQGLLGWKQVIRVAVVVVILLIIIILGSPSLQV